MRTILAVAFGAAIVWVLLPPLGHTTHDATFTGETMGTTYSIKVVGVASAAMLDECRSEVAATLARIDELMSTYRSDSDVSRFSDSDSLDWFPVAPETAEVVALAQSISKKTDGALDVTCGPLLALWGFGAKAQRRKSIPSDEEIAATKKFVGYEKLAVRLDPPAIKKSIPELTLDLSAIAKGYAVDAVARTLSQRGVSGAMVEVGGEVVACGCRRDGGLWRIGIEEPRTFDEQQAIHRVCELTSGEAMATSGNYRNYRELGGVFYSHIIDPRTGRPTEVHASDTAPNERLGSVTVFSRESCAVADAFATALFVLGEEAGIVVAERETLRVFFIVRKTAPNGAIVRTLEVE
ncbi:MAG: FAD:protein FMN transferase [Thermoguttaceae bacterium]